MDSVAARRSEIYEHFHGSKACAAYFFDPAHEEDYVAYYTGMYLLQDSTEGLMAHRSRGFDRDPLQAYVEFWGITQAVIIQQDSIAELFRVMFGRQLDSKQMPHWSRLRELRNACSGHPARKELPRSRPRTRTFMGRAFGGYSIMRYEQWTQGAGTTHPEVKFGDLLDDYAVEAEAALKQILGEMRSRWPIDR